MRAIRPQGYLKSRSFDFARYACSAEDDIHFISVTVANLRMTSILSQEAHICACNGYEYPKEIIPER
jgi:hypothetical protein